MEGADAKINEDVQTAIDTLGVCKVRLSIMNENESPKIARDVKCRIRGGSERNPNIAVDEMGNIGKDNKRQVIIEKIAIGEKIDYWEKVIDFDALCCTDNNQNQRSIQLKFVAHLEISSEIREPERSEPITICQVGASLSFEMLKTIGSTLRKNPSTYTSWMHFLAKQTEIIGSSDESIFDCVKTPEEKAENLAKLLEGPEFQLFGRP